MDRQIEDLVVNVFHQPTKIWATIAVDEKRYIVIYGAKNNRSQPGKNHVWGCNGGVITGNLVSKQREKVRKGYEVMGTFQLRALGEAAVEKVKALCETEQLDFRTFEEPGSSTAPKAKQRILLDEPLAPNTTIDRPWVF